MDTSLHYAIKKPDASGKSVNTLEVQVAPTAVSYLVNGAVVDATPTRAAIAGNSFTVTEKIGGIVGVRSDDHDRRAGGRILLRVAVLTERPRPVILR